MSVPDEAVSDVLTIRDCTCDCSPCSSWDPSPPGRCAQGVEESQHVCMKIASTVHMIFPVDAVRTFFSGPTIAASLLKKLRRKTAPTFWRRQCTARCSGPPRLRCRRRRCAGRPASGRRPEPPPALAGSCRRLRNRRPRRLPPLLAPLHRGLRSVFDDGLPFMLNNCFHLSTACPSGTVCIAA